MRRVSFGAAAFALAACSSPPPLDVSGDVGNAPLRDGGPGPGSGDASSSADASGSGLTDAAPFVQGAHPAWPQIVPLGGAILTGPEILTVTFAEDPIAPELQAFGEQAANNAYWDTIRQGYCTGSACVGDAPAGTSVQLSTLPGASYTDSSNGGASSLQIFIESLIESNAIPAPGPASLPVFYFPATTTITFDGKTSCNGLGGFHNAMLSKATGNQFAYAVVSECAKVSTLQEATFAASHEIIEAATNPFPTRAFYLDVNDPAYLPWNAIGGGEVADMCVDYLDLAQDQTTEGGFTVQRIWSNAAARAGGDPCIPAKATPYFNVAVDQWLSTQTVGSTATFTAQAFSNMDVPGGWTVTGVDLNGAGDTTSPYLTIAIEGVSAASVNNGDEITVSVTLNRDPGALTQSAGGAVGLLVSYTGTSLQAATAGAIWPFLVQTSADAADSGLVGVDAAADLPVHPRLVPAHLSPEQRAKVAKLVRGLR
jgi:hypothetical protein